MRDKSQSRPDVSLFAAFYAFAQGIERLLEPIALWRDSKLGTKPNKAKLALKAARLNRRQTVLAVATDARATGGLTTEAAATMDQATEDEQSAAAEVAAVQGERIVLYWAGATVIALLISGSLGLYFLQSILEGVPMAGADQHVVGWFRDLDILSTGIVVGSGTKPSHDLIASLEKKSDTTQSTTSGTGG